MASKISKKWENISSDCFGDFNKKEDGPFYGYVKEEHASYFGEFNKDKKPNGMNVKLSSVSTSYAKFTDGEINYPYTEIYGSGKTKIHLCKKDNLSTELEFDFKNSSFELYRCDYMEDKEGYAVFYDGLLTEFRFKKYDHGDLLSEVKVPKKFLIKNQFITDHRMSIPNILKFENIHENELNNQFHQVLYTPKGGIGIGLNTFSDGNNSINELNNGEPCGYQMFEYDDFYIVFWGNGPEFDGLKVQVNNDGMAMVMVAKSDKDKISSSAIVTIKGEEVILSDSSTGSVEDSDPCARIRYLSEISFDKGDGEWTDFYYAKKLFEEYENDSHSTKSNLDTTDPEYKMMNLIGQEDAKKEFKRIRAYVQKNDSRKIYKNIVFCGENGVGKTTVGKLIAQVLHKFKAIDSKGYIEKSAKELFDSTTGATTKNLEELYDSGCGGVILIDDLHYLEGLNLSNLKEGLIALSNLMKADASTVFILCDNKYNITQILENNTDLFQEMIRFRINFKDFTKEELEQILYNNIKEKGYNIEKDAMARLLDVIFLSKSYGNNINAKAAISILEEIIIIQNVRTEFVDDKTIIKDDIDVYVAENDISFIDQKTGYQSEARKKLDELVGLEKIKETVDDLIAYFSINRGKRVDFHMCFTGNPGTGKTEVARIIGKLLRQEGILGTSKFLEVTRRDLIGQYIGQSAIITRDIIDKAMGGVLYIDEAYSLAYGGERDFGPEVIAELLKAMEDRRGEFCVVLAGYTSEMKKLFDLNPGFRSRIKFELEFPDYNDEELEKIAQMFLKREGYTMSDDDLKLLVKLVSIQRNYPNFANVRTLREALSRIQIKHAGRMRVTGGDINSKELTYDDIITTFSKEEIEVVKKLDQKDEVKIPKLDPDVLLKNTKDYVSKPFVSNKDIMSEAILALKMSGEKTGEGTGFIVTRDGYFLTCAHCVNGKEKITARRRITHHNRYIDLNYDAKIVSIDQKADIALCKLVADSNEEFDYLVLANKNTELAKLKSVFLMGYPFGVSRFDEMSINEGKIASFQRENAKMLAQINLDIQAKGGNSGSPLINSETSEVIGVLCGSAISYGNEITEEINYARPVDYVWELLEKEFKENK